MKGLIHKGYFREVFRQLRVVGIVAAAILMLSNLTTLISLLTIQSGSLLYYSMPRGAALARVMMIYAYIAGLVFTFSAFGWMNKRSTSDFYHAIPIKRTQLYFSSILAILVWMAIGLFAYSIVHALIYLVLGYPFNYLLFLCVIANMVIGALEVVAAVSIGCAISGTRFVNLFASAVILFIPRFLLSMLAIFVRRIGSETLVVSSISVFFNPSYNIIAVPYASLLNQAIGKGSVDYANGWAMLYNLVYDAVLFLLGWIAFKKRKSETAGMPTTGRLFNGVIRTAVGMPFLLLLVFFLLSDGFNIVLCVVLVLLAFVFFCLYELISTKRAKKMLKAMPLFFICIGISLLFLGIPYLIDRIERSVSVTPENTKGYWLVNDGEDDYGIISDLFDSSVGSSSYSDAVTESVKITDPESIKIISDAYQKSVSDQEYLKFRSLTIKIDRKFGRDITRELSFSPSEYSKLMSIRRENPRIAKADFEFPRGNNFYAIETLSRRDAALIGNSFRKEYESLSENDRAYLTGETNSVKTLYVFGSLGAKNYMTTYSMGELTPNTTALYYQLLNKKNAERFRKDINDIISWMESKDSDDHEFFIGIGRDNGEVIGMSSWNLRYNMNSGNTGKAPKDTDPLFYELVMMLSKAELTDNADRAKLIQINNYSDYLFNESSYVLLDLTDEQAERFFEIIDRYNVYYDYDSVEEEPIDE